jgi:hypothetical protein
MMPKRPKERGEGNVLSIHNMQIRDHKNAEGRVHRLSPPFNNAITCTETF